MHVNIQPISPVPCQANLLHTRGSLHTTRKAALIEGLTVNQLGVDKRCLQLNGNLSHTP